MFVPAIFKFVIIRIWGVGCLLGDIVDGPNETWCERVYAAKAAGLILYGRALGLSHGEAEDVLQETFLAVMQKESPPELPEPRAELSARALAAADAGTGIAPVVRAFAG